jgi:hypothetical protein
MTLYAFSVPKITIEASSEEDAISKVASRLGAIARHLGNEVELKANKPFFTLSEVEKGEPADIGHDPIVEARNAAEAEREAQSVSAAEVGNLDDVLKA